MRAGFLGNLTRSRRHVRAFPFDWSDIAIMAAWGVVGVVSLAARFFSWEPRR